MRKPRPAEGEETSWKTWPGHAVFLWGKATQDVSRPPRRCARPFCGQLRARGITIGVCTSSLSKLVSAPVSAFLLRFPPVDRKVSRVSNTGSRANESSKSSRCHRLTFIIHTHVSTKKFISLSQPLKLYPFFNRSSTSMVISNKKKNYKIDISSAIFAIDDWKEKKEGKEIVRASTHRVNPEKDIIEEEEKEEGKKVSGREESVAPKLSRNIPGAPGSVSVAEGVRRRMRRSRGSLSPRQGWPGLSSLGNQLDFPCTSHPARPGYRSHQPFPNGCSLSRLSDWLSRVQDVRRLQPGEQR